MITQNKFILKLIICSLIVLTSQLAKAQNTQPTWWFGVSGAANLNYYNGTTQRLNNSLIVPTAFHKGTGVRPYGSILMEYRPGRILGAMLNIGYDGRGANFDDVIAPCNCPATLKTNISYLSIEPSLRLGLRTSNLYFFAGPRVALNINKDFNYTQLKQADTNAELSEVRNNVFSGQVGMGYDYQISSPSNATKVVLSPFISFHPYFGQDPRDIESLSITTVRTGIALKFGKGGKELVTETQTVVPVRDVNFTVREPKTIPAKRQVSETLPLLNYVFFDEGSSEIPSRYVMLNKNQAASFKETQLEKEQTVNMTGRSARQLNVYYNILNILGDRLRSNSGTSINLSGASAKGREEGQAFAEAIKKYIVDTYEIASSRITTEGRVKPLIPSEQPGGTKELTLLRAGDRRVDIESTSLELLMEVGGGMMKPVQIVAIQADPLDSHVIFKVDGAKDVLRSWSLNLTDENGKVQNFGPFTRDQESLPGKTVLGTKLKGDYKVVMLGTNKKGESIRKESTIHLEQQNELIEKGYRYSILFNFDKTKTIGSYENFLKDVVSPLITDGSTVIIHGHTDMIGDEAYNHTLSHNRAMQTQKIIETSLSKLNRKNVKFETFGFGEDDSSPFENNLPEERFYNRTVIIDIIPVK